MQRDELVWKQIGVESFELRRNRKKVALVAGCKKHESYFVSISGYALEKCTTLYETKKRAIEMVDEFDRRGELDMWVEQLFNLVRRAPEIAFTGGPIYGGDFKITIERGFKKDDGKTAAVK